MRAGRPDRASGDSLRRRVRHVLPADDAVEALLVHAGITSTSVVAVEDLGGDLDLGIFRNHLRRDFYSVDDLDAGLDDGVVLHVAHADEVVDLRDAQPVQDVGHQRLESRILNTCYRLGTVEIPTKGQVSRLDGVVASMASKG